MEFRNALNLRSLLKICVAITLATQFVSNALGNEVNKVEINGTEITYVEQGDGPLLILAHGSVSDYKRWMKDHMPLFADDYRVVTYSMRYHGETPWDESLPPLSMDLYASDLADLIQFLDDEPAHLVGWSMGARVVHRVALKYPALVRSAYLYEGAAAMNKNPADSKEEQDLRDSFYGKSMSLANNGEYEAAVGCLLYTSPSPRDS